MRRVASRTSFQTARPGWRPRQQRPQALAQAIVASIRQHQARGIPRRPEQYTTNPVTLRLVEELLKA